MLLKIIVTLTWMDIHLSKFAIQNAQLELGRWRMPVILAMENVFRVILLVLHQSIWMLTDFQENFTEPTLNYLSVSMKNNFSITKMILLKSNFFNFFIIYFLVCNIFWNSTLMMCLKVAIIQILTIKNHFWNTHKI